MCTILNDGEPQVATPLVPSTGTESSAASAGGCPLMLAIAMNSASRGDEPAISRAEFDQLHKELNLKNQPWATISWKVTLTALQTDGKGSRISSRMG